MNTLSASAASARRVRSKPISLSRADSAASPGGNCDGMAPL